MMAWKCTFRIEVLCNVGNNLCIGLSESIYYFPLIISPSEVKDMSGLVQILLASVLMSALEMALVIVSCVHDTYLTDWWVFIKFV